jgi:hypothetical protein
MSGMDGSAAGKPWRLPNFIGTFNHRLAVRTNGLLPGFFRGHDLHQVNQKQLPNGAKKVRSGLRTNAIFSAPTPRPVTVMAPCRELKEALNEQGGQHEQSDVPQRLPADALAFSSDGF